MMPLQQAPNGDWFHEDKPAEWHWSEEGNRFWYEERPHFIVHYYKSQPDKIVVFANQAFQPGWMEVHAVIERALKAAGVNRESRGLALDHWSGKNNVWWYADLIEVQP
jgi:hypothetical protein